MDTLSQAIIGYCDTLSATSIEGWAYDRTAPDVPLVMQVLSNGNHICWTRCDLLRRDVQAAGHPAQRVGFYVPIPPDLQHDGDHVIELRSRDGSPIALEDPVGVHYCWALPKTTRAPRREAQA